LELDPDNPQARCNHAHYMLVNGDLKNGFAEHRWERKCKNPVRHCPAFSQPEMAGRGVPGRTLLLFSE